jgi:hypothetical protein
MGTTQPPTNTRRCLFILVSIPLALIFPLGLGLGLGLRHRISSQSTTVPSAAPTLQSQLSSNFVLTGLVGIPAQTRVFNFTISQVQGAPDGFSRPMLVVNGNTHPFLIAFSAFHAEDGLYF